MHEVARALEILAHMLAVIAEGGTPSDVDIVDLRETIAAIKNNSQ